jgi:Tfp pilus assembly protein FimT
VRLHRAGRRRAGGAGLSLLEVVVYIAILSLIASALYAVLTGSTRQYEVGTKLSGIQEKGRRAMDELVAELRMADRDPGQFLVTTVNGSQQLQFRISTGFAGGTAVFGTPITWNCPSSTVDANGNRIVDEARLVRTQDGRAITKTHYVKQGGFTATVSGNNVLLRLTMLNNDGYKKVIESTVESAVTLRNDSSP